MIQHDNILIVSVPEESRYYGIDDRYECIYFKLPSDFVYINLPPGDWRILGRTKELTEEQWKEVVPELHSIAGRWPNYCGGHPFFSTATGSGMSLLRSHGIYPETNPLILKNERV